MKISEIISYLEDIAPPAYQESYDNSGLIVGNRENELKKGLICLDVTQAVLDEAIRLGANFIVSHHPLLFHGIKSVTGKTLQEQLLIKAIRHDITIYAMHTNLDNIFLGVNDCLAKELKVINTNVLRPQKQILRKLVTFVPKNKAEIVRNALFDAGGGHVGNYDFCSYNTEGKGSFRGNENTNPYVGEKNILHFEDETRIEIIFPHFKERSIISTLLEAHPYEEPAYDIYMLENQHPSVGSGMIGLLENEMKEDKFLYFVKKQLNLKVLKHSKNYGRAIKKVAFCGGSGSFLLADALSQKADAFITGEIHYHDFVDHEKNILIVGVGHYESEHFIKQFLYKKLIKKNDTFAVSKTEENPVCYLT